MIELIVVSITCLLIAGAWIALWIDNEKSVIKGVCMAVGLPLMVISMIALVIYVIDCFIVVLN